MEHRHLLPNEIDLLVDGEEGFGVAPLQAHVAQCARCSAEVESQRQLVTTLERLPHLSPSPLFAHRVMSQVRVFEPWHVAALDSVRRMIPRTRPAQILAGTFAGVVSITLTLATFWIGSRLDLLSLLTNVATERIRGSVLTFAASAVSSLLGEGAATALLASGPTGMAVAFGAFLLTVILAALGLRTVAVSAYRRRM